MMTETIEITESRSTRGHLAAVVVRYTGDTVYTQSARGEVRVDVRRRDDATRSVAWYVTRGGLRSPSPAGIAAVADDIIAEIGPWRYHDPHQVRVDETSAKEIADAVCDLLEMEES